MIVKNLNFGKQARDQVFKGIEKLTNAVSSTLGASGKCFPGLRLHHPRPARWPAPGQARSGY